MNTATLNNNNNQVWFISTFAASVIVLAIGYQGLQLDYSAIPDTTPSQQELLIKQAKGEMAMQYQSILKNLNTTNLNPDSVENPGLEQATIINLGLQLQQAMLEQIQDPSHPNYRQSIQGALFRAIITNGTQMLLASEVEIPTTEKDGQPGIVLSYYSQQQQKQLMLRMPPEMLKVVSQAYVEALVSQSQLNHRVPFSTAVQSQQLIQNLQSFADSQLEVSAYEGNDQMVSQLQDLNSQLKEEKEVQYYVDLNGVYSENN